MSAATKRHQWVLATLLFLLPFILLLPSFWLVCESPVSSHLLRSHQAHHRADLGGLWGNIFFPFCAVCFLLSAVILSFCARESRVARWGRVLPSICCVFALILLYDNLFGPQPASKPLSLNKSASAGRWDDRAVQSHSVRSGHKNFWDFDFNEPSLTFPFASRWHTRARELCHHCCCREGDADGDRYG
jgi:hypothetical protein